MYGLGHGVPKDDAKALRWIDASYACRGREEAFDTVANWMTERGYTTGGCSHTLEDLLAELEHQLMEKRW